MLFSVEALAVCKESFDDPADRHPNRMEVLEQTGLLTEPVNISKEDRRYLEATGMIRPGEKVTTAKAEQLRSEGLL